jgi:hypothetical protein
MRISFARSFPPLPQVFPAPKAVRLVRIGRSDLWPLYFALDFGLATQQVFGLNWSRFEDQEAAQWLQRH